jgi:hypothetical protein
MPCRPCFEMMVTARRDASCLGSQAVVKSSTKRHGNPSVRRCSFVRIQIPIEWRIPPQRLPVDLSPQVQARTMRHRVTVPSEAVSRSPRWSGGVPLFVGKLARNKVRLMLQLPGRNQQFGRAGGVWAAGGGNGRRLSRAAMLGGEWHETAQGPPKAEIPAISSFKASKKKGRKMSPGLPRIGWQRSGVEVPSNHSGVPRLVGDREPCRPRQPSSMRHAPRSSRCDAVYRQTRWGRERCI